MTIQARYSGECPECGDRWQPGDLIRHNGDEWAHVVCPDDVFEEARTPCERCWQIPSVSGACGCEARP